MVWAPLESSMIDGYDHDADMGVLHVRFRGGRTVSLQGVPQEVVDDFVASPSKGKFYHANLRDAYKLL